jgi:hypothetical protein
MSTENTQRDELQAVIYGYFGPPDQVRPYKKSPVEQDRELAAAILAAGYSKPTILGYVVVGRDGHMIGAQHSTSEEAQAMADEWTKDCEVAGVDWDYRVAEIVEASK